MFQVNVASIIKTETVYKASSVFLRVALSVNSILEGLRDGEKMRHLFDRLEQLPTQLEGLFRKILEQLIPEYFGQASELFSISRGCY